MLIVRFKATFRERAPEWVLSLMLMSWGFVVLFSASLFDRPWYAPLRDLMPQWLWGWLALTVGLLRLVVLYINGAWRRSPVYRQIGAMFGLLVWSMLMMGSLNAWPTPAIVIYLGLFTMDALNLSFASRDAAIGASGKHGHG